MNKHEVNKANTYLLMKLCRDVGDIEKMGKTKAKQCTLIINDALIKLEELK